MKEEILQLFERDNKALEVTEINDLLKLETVEELKQLLETLTEMEESLQLRKTNKNKYLKHDDLLVRKGVLISTKGEYAFVKIIDEKPPLKDVYIASNDLHGAIHGDTVIVKVNQIDERPSGKITKIINRALQTLVGEIYLEKDELKLHIDDHKVKMEIIILKEKSMNAMPGHKVLVKIMDRTETGSYLGEVLIILGHVNDPGVDILSLVYKHGINPEFSDEVMEELNHIPNEVNPEDIYFRKEHDLRDEIIFTIDGADTKDIDDAIGIKKLDNGNYELGVHIADVSYYVKEGTALYREAMERATSVYLADRVIPMLPHKLSNGICSLNPNVDRLAVSCMMEINQNGKVVSSHIFPSIINSKKQMTYKDVNQILEQNSIPEGYEEYANDLLLMKELAAILRSAKVRRGFIDFDIDEAKIIVDETGKAIDVVLRERGTGEKIIEDFMIVANETVAEYITSYEFLPFVYRVHGTPSEEKITQFITYVSSCGYKLVGKFQDLHPSSIQKILDQLKDKKEFKIFSSLLLRSMQKAIYDTKNIGHFGLGSRCYCHFTSPIRRFPDTTVHRLLHKFIFDNKMDHDTVQAETEKLVSIALHSSEKERSSIDCERDVDDMKKAEYMKDHIGEAYEGMISSIMSYGIYVQLPNLIEGLVRVDDLKDDHYTFDESTLRLVGKKNKRGYRLGDKVSIIVKDARKEVGEIDFVINDQQNSKQANTEVI